MASACSIRVRGVVQGVGFRPYVYRLARANTLGGWVLNDSEGVEIYLEGAEQGVESFVHDLRTQPPPAADIAEMEVHEVPPRGLHEFTIRESERQSQPTTRVSPDLPVCDECIVELFDPDDPRYLYPYINCTNCGPRYTVIRGLPYDRPNTTMKAWPLDSYCAGEYGEPSNRRFHAQPVACPHCGPEYYLQSSEDSIAGSDASIESAAAMLRAGRILAIKGLGGYHLVCDARNPGAVRDLRERKYRKEKPFAVMAQNLDVAHELVDLCADAEALLTSGARPIMLAPAKVQLGEVAPNCDELGVMLPYTPLHHLLFSAGAPSVLVMTSANRSSEPIAYEDENALTSLLGIADAFLIGQRPIARRVDDSVARAGVFGPVILRRGRGYAPAAVAKLPTKRPILALGADLKNTVTLVVEGQAFMSQHIGDLDHYGALRAFRETVADLLTMYEVNRDELLLVHDAHPQYASSLFANDLKVANTIAVQHHRAHIASVLAEMGEWERQVAGVSFDGTGYGDDGSIWGGEIFVGSVREGLERVAHLRPASVPGGDAAAHFPVQAAAGFLAQVEELPDLTAEPFNFSERYGKSAQLVQKNVRNFSTSSIGRLFDTAAALLGFTRPISFEGQAAMWVEHLAWAAPEVEPYPFLFHGGQLDFRPLLRAVIRDRVQMRSLEEIARAFQHGIAAGVRDALAQICNARGLNTVVLSGGVFQNEMLMADLKFLLERERFQVWMNHTVPPNDGGISLGQAALAAFSTAGASYHA
jgi:hydrogenase maturation protein HypF